MTSSLFSLRARKSAICRAMPARARGSVPGLACAISPRRLLTISHRAVGKQAQMTIEPGRNEGQAAGLGIAPQAAPNAGHLGERADDGSGCGKRQSRRPQARRQRQGGGQEEQGQKVGPLPIGDDGGDGVEDEGGDEEEIE